jgi:hypothetical protein
MLVYFAIILFSIPGDGSVRVWKDYTQKDKHRLATSWQAVQGHRPGVRGISAVVDWQQMTGYLARRLTYFMIILLLSFSL